MIRYAAQPAAASEPDHHEPQQDADEQPADPSRYDDALYGPIESVEQENAADLAYPDDPYAYQRGYKEEPEPRLEAINGVLLFGVSTAYLFSVMQVYWSMLTAHATPSQG